MSSRKSIGKPKADLPPKRSARVSTEITATHFEPSETWKLKDKGCCAILFYHPQCGHCTTFKPTFDAVAKTCPFLKFFKIDCQKHHSHMERMAEEAAGMNITSYPTVVFYSKGKPSETVSGNKPYEQFLADCMRARTTMGCP